MILSLKNSIQKKFTKPKKLNLKEMWKLYRTLKSGMSGTLSPYFLDEIIKVMHNITEDDFIDSIGILYGWGVHKNKHPIELGLLFSSGLKKNNIFEFREFIKVIGR